MACQLVGYKDGTLVEVDPDGPAGHAGVCVGWKIIAVNGIKMDHDYFIEKALESGQSRQIDFIADPATFVPPLTTDHRPLDISEDHDSSEMAWSARASATSPRQGADDKPDELYSEQGIMDDANVDDVGTVADGEPDERY